MEDLQVLGGDLGRDGGDGGSELEGSGNVMVAIGRVQSSEEVNPGESAAG